MRRIVWCALLCMLVIAQQALAQPRPQVLPLHTAEAGASANGATVPTFGYEAVAVQNTIAAAWDGTLTYEVTTNGTDWTAVTCRNALSTVTGSTTVAAAGYVVCPVTGAQSFRARVSGRTVGTVTAVAAMIAQSGSGVGTTVPPVGAAATQVQGTANDGVAEVGNPVQVGGVDAGGLMQAFLVGTDGRQDVNVGQVAGATITAGAGAVAAGTPRMTLASNDPAVTALEIIDDWDEANRAAVNLIAGQVAIAGGAGINAANVVRVTVATDDEINDDLDAIRVAVEVIDNAIHTRNEAFGEAVAIGGEFDDTGPVAATEGNVSPVRISVRRELYTQLRDAAGNERGANVNASNALLVAQTGELPAGTQNIGDVDVVSVVPGTGATNLGKAEDAGHTTGDTGVMILGVRNDTRGTLAGTDLDYAPLQLNSAGDLRVTTPVAPTAATIDTENAGQTADFDIEPATTNLRLLGWSVREDAASAAVATVVLRHGVLAAGNCTATAVIGYIELGPNQSSTMSYGDRGLAVPSGVCADVLAGSVSVVVHLVTESAP